MTANMLPSGLAAVLEDQALDGRNLQEVSNGRDEGVDDGSDRVHADSPWPGVLVILLHNHDLLLDAVGAQDRLLLQVLLGQVLLQCLSTVHDHISPLHLLVQPLGLLDRLDGKEGAEDDGEHDQEDAAGGVSANAVGSPRLDVQGRLHVILESHHHGCHHRGHVG